MKFCFVWVFPLTSSMLFSILAVQCVYPTLYSYLKTVRKGKMKVLNSNELEVESQQFKSVHLVSLIGTNVTVTIVIITFQVISTTQLLECVKCLSMEDVVVMRTDLAPLMIARQHVA